MKTVNVYLSFDNNCEEAFNFYKSVFGGEFSYIGKFKDMPPMEGMPPLSEEDGNKIIHVGLPISKETMLMGCDNMNPDGSKVVFGNNCSISVGLDSRQEADAIFAKLSAGGTVIMPMADMFWGDYYGYFCDKFGIYWMINCNCKSA